MWKFIALLVVFWLLSGCASLLPSAQTESSTFQSFEEARNAIEAMVPMKSTRLTVSASGFDLDGQPNTKILTHSDVVRLLVPTGLLKRGDLDPGILVCLEARDACQGLDITASHILKNRTGNFFADFTNFRRRTQTTGWRFNALILFVNDLVVYRSWGGQPRVNEVDVATKPLGPFQDIGPALVSTAR